MRILWFTNTSSCYKRGPANCYNGGGWISSLEIELKKKANVELGVCFYADFVSELKKEEQDGTVYYILPRPKKSVRYIIETIINKPEVTTYKHEKLAIPALVDIVNDFRPDIIQVFGSENIYGLITNYVSIPVVLHIQGILTTYLNAFLPPFISWSMYIRQDNSIRNILHRTSDKIAWKRNSLTEQRMLCSVKHFMGRSIWDERIVKLLNPKGHYHFCNEMLRSTFYDISERCLSSKAVFVTTISSSLYKGYDLLLKTAQILKGEMGDFEWLVFGDINPNFVERVFNVNHKEVGVHLMGVASAEQIKGTLLSATAYVHTSYIENSSNSVCEAQLLGIPCIATNVGGIPTLIEDGFTGYLVPANDPYQMAFLMKFLAESKDVNIEMGKRAKEVAMKRHDRKTIVNRVMDIYEEILSKE